MTDPPDNQEIPTLPTLSRDANRLAELHGEWRDLQVARARGMSQGVFGEASRDLARRIVEHRATLFAINAAIQAEHAELDRNLIVELDANQDAVKFCTIMLGEISAALGLTSLPVTE